MVDLIMRGSGQVERAIRAVVDTGYNGSLSLPIELVEDLALVRRSSQRGVLADGSEAVFAVYLGTVVWDGTPRQIRVLATAGAPLIGMALLAGHELTIQVVAGGA